MDQVRTTATPRNQFIVRCSVRSHHVYKRIWSPCVGELFETFCKEDNEHDMYAMAVHLNNCFTVVRHIPREITRTRVLGKAKELVTKKFVLA